MKVAIERLKLLLKSNGMTVKKWLDNLMKANLISDRMLTIKDFV